MNSTGTAEVVRKYVDESFDPVAPVMVLRWDGGERLWELPEGLSVAGPGPSRLGLRVRRRDGDRYAVRLLWDRTLMAWDDVSKVEILGCCLGPLLAAIGLDLWSMLEQPAGRLKVRAA